MRRILRHGLPRPMPGVVGHEEVEPRRLQRKAARGQHLPALLKNRQFPVLASDPIANQPIVPEMAPARFVAEPPRRADERSGEDATIRAAEIEGSVES